MIKKASSTSSALKIACLYAVVAGLWILVSDWLLFDRIAPKLEDYIPHATLSMMKGLGFVTVTAIMLFLLVRAAVARIIASEARLQLLFSSVNDCIHLMQMEDEGVPGNFLDANEAAMRLYGYSRDELLNMSILDIIGPDRKRDCMVALEILWKKGQVVFQTEYVSKGGEIIPVEINSRLVRIQGTLVAIGVARDMRPRIQEEEEREAALLEHEKDKRRFYRETLYAVTEGRFLLCEMEEAASWIEKPELVTEISEPKQLSNVRSAVTEYTHRAGLPDEIADDFEIAVGEALGNAVKHAGSGQVYAGIRDEEVWVAVTDKGGGMDTFVIPKIAFMPGYSTKTSMGLGYTLMLRFADSVRLATDSTGTVVWLSRKINPPAEDEESLATFIAVN